MTRSTTSVSHHIASLAIVAALAGTSTQLQAQDAFVALDVSSRPAAAAEVEKQASDLLLEGRSWERAAGLYLLGRSMTAIHSSTVVAGES